MLFSIVMPVYNVEIYLERAIRSIVNQSFISWELILVDDGSNDRSVQMVDEWQVRDSRIRAFHQRNKGASAARNLGMKYCRGNYIYFVDADDYLEQGLLAEIAQVITNTQADVVLVNAKRFFKEGKFKKPELYFTSAYTEDNLRKLLLCGLVREPFTKVCKSEIIKGKKYRENLKSAEDLAFVPDIMESAKTFACTEKHFYFYNKMNESSITRIKSELQNDVCGFWACYRFLKFCKEYRWDRIDYRLPELYRVQCIACGLNFLQHMVDEDKKVSETDYQVIIDFLKANDISIDKDIDNYRYLNYYFSYEEGRLCWSICDTSLGAWESRFIKSFYRFYSVNQVRNQIDINSEIESYLKLIDKHNGGKSLSTGQFIKYKLACYNIRWLLKREGEKLLR